MPRKKLWTISNFLSFSRFLLVFPVTYLMLSGGQSNRIVAVGLTLFGALTDFLDGYFARKYSQVTDMGKIIDPLADKLAIGALVTILMIQGSLPLWFFISVIVRDVVIFIGGVYVKKKTGILLQSNWLGKWTAGILALLCGVAMVGFSELETIKGILLFGSTMMIVASFTSYCQRFVNMMFKSEIKN